MKDTIYGPNREENEKKRDKILKAVYKGVFKRYLPNICPDKKGGCAT